MKKLFLVLPISAVIILTACSSSNNSNTNNSTTPTRSVSPTNSGNNSSTETFTEAELSAFNGKGGNKCYVAVDGNVYEIINTTEWQNGIHVPSNGLAKCGVDLTDVFDQSPHGRSVLQTDARMIGTLE